MESLVAFLTRGTRGAIKTKGQALFFLATCAAIIFICVNSFMKASQKKNLSTDPNKLNISAQEIQRIKGNGATVKNAGRGAPPPAAAAAPAPAKAPVVQPTAGAHANAAPVVSTTTTETPAYLTYRYRGEQYRDPFVPLTGSNSGNATANNSVPALSSFTIKGVIQDTQGKIALLISGNRSFILRGGRLYDGQNRQVKGVSGVVKPNSVLLISADKTTRELKIPTVELPVKP